MLLSERSLFLPGASLVTPRHLTNTSLTEVYQFLLVTEKTIVVSFCKSKSKFVPVLNYSVSHEDMSLCLMKHHVMNRIPVFVLQNFSISGYCCGSANFRKIHGIISLCFQKHLNIYILSEISLKQKTYYKYFSLKSSRFNSHRARNIS